MSEYEVEEVCIFDLLKMVLHNFFGLLTWGNSRNKRFLFSSESNLEACLHGVHRTLGAHVPQQR